MDPFQINKNTIILKDLYNITQDFVNKINFKEGPPRPTPFGRNVGRFFRGGFTSRLTARPELPGPDGRVIFLVTVALFAAHLLLVHIEYPDHTVCRVVAGRRR